MSIEQLKTMKECLMGQVQGQMGNLAQVNTQELGEAIDMIKDLSKAVYYCTITEAMEKSEENGGEYSYYRDMDRNSSSRMYYSGSSGEPSSSSSSGNNGNRSYYYYYDNNGGSNNTNREGNGNNSTENSRRSYMEAKNNNRDKASQTRELERYIMELTHDITDMIEGANQEDKQLLQHKLQLLANKIV